MLASYVLTSQTNKICLNQVGFCSMMAATVDVLLEQKFWHKKDFVIWKNVFIT